MYSEFLHSDRRSRLSGRGAIQAKPDGHYVLVGLLLLFLSCPGALRAQAGKLQISQPHVQRTEANLLENADVGSAPTWQMRGTVAFDSTVSRTPGTGSVRLSTVRDRITSGLIPVDAMEVYTFSFYLKTDDWPPPMTAVSIRAFDAEGRQLAFLNGSRQSPTDSTQWQESILFFKPRPGDVFIRFDFMLDIVRPGSSGSIWLDDFYLGRGLGFDQPPAPKIPFEGSRVRVDALGNIEIPREKGWQPFFPLTIYYDNRRPDWSDYSRQGFNSVMWARHYSQVQRAKEAVSTFNPNGMMSGYELASYMTSESPEYNDLHLLETRLEEIELFDLEDWLLFYYWDNEHLDEWEVPEAVIQTIRTHDADETGQLQRPIYVLQGQEGVARAYNNDHTHMSDITGTYTDTDEILYGPGGSSKNFMLLSLIQNQQSPTVFIQMNDGIGPTLRPRLFSAISKGAKGMGFWRDFYNDPGRPRIEDQPWWDDFPNIRREIDLMIPLIREPHWTSWRVHSSSEFLDLGTRDMGRWSYLIVANMSNDAVESTLFLDGLAYRADEVIDYFTGERVTFIQNQTFEISLPAYGTAVYRLISSELPVTRPAFEANLAHFNLSETELNQDRPVDHPISTTAGGSINALLSQDTLFVSGSFHELAGHFSAMHLHEALPGHVGPIRANLTPHMGASTHNGMVNEQIMLTDSLVQALLSGTLYLDIHTTLLRDGELRGQLLAVPNHAPPQTTLITPLPEHLDTSRADSSNLTLRWEPVTDTDSNAVMYQLEFALNPRFESSILVQPHAVIEPNAVSYTLTVNELALILKRLSVDKDKTVQLHYRVNTTDGSLRTTGVPYTVTITYEGGGPVGTEQDRPTGFAILGLFPHPVHQTATLVFDLPEPAQVEMSIFDIQGREVASLPPRAFAPGAGRFLRLYIAYLSSGSYIYRVTARTSRTVYSETGRMVIVH